MKSGLAGKIHIAIIFGSLCCPLIGAAQPAAGPLDIQGLDQLTVAGVRSRGMGGTAIASANDASAIFSNPAALARLTAFEFRMGGFFGFASQKQTQEWVPYMTNPGLSVLFESLTGSIPIPRDSLGNQLTGWKAVQKQYDDIQPNWNRSSSTVQPLSAAAAMPISAAGITMTAGIGISQAMNLDHYYQNNNALSPYLGQLRPDPKIITKPLDTVDAQWYQYIRERKGKVYGITPGVSVPVLPGLSLGVSATILTGSSDDKEVRVERGHIFLATNNKSAANDFLVDTVYYRQTKTGTSTYSGKMFTVGMLLQQEHFSLGVTIHPAYTLTRTWGRDVTSIDTTLKPIPVRIDTLIHRTYHASGTDDLNFPLAYSFGIVLTPNDLWTISFDYDVRRLSAMELTSSVLAAASQPWTNNYGTMHFGAEYRPSTMLALRAGYGEDIQCFSPDGSAIIGEPARGGIYSLGAGVAAGSVGIDFAYGYTTLKYQDIYQSNVNDNDRSQHQFAIELAYRF